MSKNDLIDLHGVVVAVHSGGLYRVKCDAGHEMLAQLSGRMRRFHIRVVPGDRVTVGLGIDIDQNTVLVLDATHAEVFCDEAVAFVDPSRSPSAPWLRLRDGERADVK